MKKQYNFIIEEKNEKDSFGVHSNIAKTISNIIHKMDLKKNSFHLGVFGDWGSGKSFIINRIEENLADKEEILFINLDVWKFIGTPLMRSILIEIDKSLELLSNKKDNLNDYRNDYEKEWLKKRLYYYENFTEEVPVSNKEIGGKIIDLFKKYQVVFYSMFVASIIFALILKFLNVDSSLFYSIISSTLISSGIFISGFLGIKNLLLKPLEEFAEVVLFKRETKDFRSNPNFSPEQFEDIFNELIEYLHKNNNNSKLVLVFDNIDRCEPRLAYEMMSTIKTYMDSRNCFYIIPCDDEALLNYLSNEVQTKNSSCDTSFENFEREYAREFIDKFFQTYFRIPKLKEVDRDNFIKEQLKLLKLPLKEEREIEKIASILYYAYKGLTPRQIKRFINDFAMYYYIAQECDKDIKVLLKSNILFAIMICIKQRWSKFETYLIENPGFFEEFLDSSLDYKEKLKDFNGLIYFLNNIKDWISKDISVHPFIFFKESDNEREVIELLRNAEVIELSPENFKIIAKYLSKDSTETYLNNSLRSIGKSLAIKEFKKDYNVNNFFWRKLNTSDKYINVINSLLESEETSDKLVHFFILITERLKATSEILLSKYILKTDNEETCKKLMENMIKNDLVFLDKNTSLWFENIEENFERIKLLIKTFAEHKYWKYLTDSSQLKISDKVFISNTVIDENYLNLIEMISSPTLKTKSKNIIANNYLTYIVQSFAQIKTQEQAFKQRFSNTPNYDNSMKASVASIKAQFKLVIRGLKLFNIENFIEKAKAKEELGFLTFIARHFDKIDFEGFIQEIIWFLGDDENRIAKELIALFSRDGVIDIIFDKERYHYITKSLENDYFKNHILQNENLTNKLYSSINFNEFKLDEDFDLFQTDEIIPSNIFQFYSIYSNEEDIENLDIEKLNKIVCDKGIQILRERGDFSILSFISEKGYSLSLIKHEIIQLKNKIIDYFKELPSEALEFLITLQNEFATEFEVEVLIPILNYIHSELENTKDVDSFFEIHQLIDSSMKEDTKIIIRKIYNLLLQEGQNFQEKILGIQLQEKLNETDQSKLESYSILFSEEEINSNSVLGFLRPNLEDE